MRFSEHLEFFSTSESSDFQSSGSGRPAMPRLNVMYSDLVNPGDVRAVMKLVGNGSRYPAHTWFDLESVKKTEWGLCRCHVHSVSGLRRLNFWLG